MKAEIRKRDGRWWVQLPQFGFTPRPPVPFTEHADALGYALEEVARRTAPQGVSAALYAESWAPWTMKAPRLHGGWQ